MATHSKKSRPQSPRDSFPIVGIGASAGGLQAFVQFFSKLPPDSGMAYVLVPHLDPDHKSQLSEILQRATAMPVREARDQMATAPNNVYIIPPDSDMSLFHGHLQLSPAEQPRGQRLPIDSFLRSLAEDQGEQAMAIIFTGTGSDGSQGLRAILGAGGITLVQDPATAQYAGMPKSAAAYATHVLSIDAMPSALMAGIGTLARRHTPGAVANPIVASTLTRILMQLRTGTGCDFSQYKKSTINRRIERRMSAHGIDDAEIYVRLLKENPSEVQILFKDLLINVTCFFRDPEAYELLKQEILPLLREALTAEAVFRVWVAGCASGEEAYSIAILLREFMAETGQTFPVQIYATDLDDDAICSARTGRYPANIASDVTPERLKRFFLRDAEGYKVNMEIRDMVVFAVQNVIKDPPFTRLDLLCCRNLMIYLEPELQSRLIAVFHFSLKPGGVLFLSPSEGIGRHTTLFTARARKWKLFQSVKTPESSRARLASGLTWNTEKGGKFAQIIPMKTNDPAVDKIAKTGKPIPAHPHEAMGAAAQRIEALEQDLALAKDSLQTAAMEQQAFVEDLKLTVEEMQSTNEELHATNEELETSREEQQSVNEELSSVNVELQSRIDQLSAMQNDMKNLLDNVKSGTILLDENLLIRRFSREVGAIYHLVAADVGRPLADFKSELEDEELLKEAQSVMDSLVPIEHELRSRSGSWFLARIQPYRTLDNRIEGVVLTFSDINEVKRKGEALLQSEIRTANMKLARELAEAIVDTVTEPLVVLDGDLQVIKASRSFYQYFQVAEAETVGRKIYDLGNSQWDIPVLRTLLENILPERKGFSGYEMEHDFPRLGHRHLVLNARRIASATGASDLILLAMVQDI